jgi:hypothetical protein
MEQLFRTLKYDAEFRVQAVLFIRMSLGITHMNYDALCVDPLPSRPAGPNEILLKFGDTRFSCKIVGPDNYQFT